MAYTTTSVVFFLAIVGALGGPDLARWHHQKLAIAHDIVSVELAMTYVRYDCITAKETISQHTANIVVHLPWMLAAILVLCVFSPVDFVADFYIVPTSVMVPESKTSADAPTQCG
ncbi:hypothetical protein CVT25_015909 [Psilocybe cyanescens]|uniref:Uncharacterized protein n=1 Tax=Psilocybe cyanescens TaxID=93625 RepID=A0A409WSA0_PSICY|nr:hypothetical protein CVT25_015909 [Psilocybe cyanescens]